MADAMEPCLFHSASDNVHCLYNLDYMNEDMTFEVVENSDILWVVAFQWFPQEIYWVILEWTILVKSCNHTIRLIEQKYLL